LKQPVIFCDFDGTITHSDNIVAMMRHYEPPGYLPILEAIVEGRKSIRQGVGEMFALLPSSMKEELTSFVVDNVRIRDGFAELLAFCKERDIPFYVTSGGIDFFVLPVLAPFDIDPSHIYCNSADFSGPNIEILWPHACDAECDNDCGMCKTRVIRRFPKENYFRILIGDSLTDYAGAQIADLVFARSHLARRCKELHLPHHEYETFHDVIDVLRNPGGAIPL